MANEKRLIDAEAIERKIKKANCVECNVVRKVQCSACWVNDVLDLLDGDAVDAVEVVRCKDCVHRKEKVCYNPSAGMWVGVELKDSDFCSYGERREGE